MQARQSNGGVLGHYFASHLRYINVNGRTLLFFASAGTTRSQGIVRVAVVVVVVVFVVFVVVVVVVVAIVVVGYCQRTRMM